MTDSLRLTDGEKIAIGDKLAKEYEVTWDEIFESSSERRFLERFVIALYNKVAEAQLQKIINDPDIVCIESCKRCDGRGVFNSKDYEWGKDKPIQCSECHGTGIIPSKEKLIERLGEMTEEPKQKPPILKSYTAIDPLMGTERVKYPGNEEQRDADVAYYEPLLEQAREQGKEDAEMNFNFKILPKCLLDARQETAEQLATKLETEWADRLHYYVEQYPKANAATLTYYVIDDFIQALKKQFIKE